MRLDRLPPLATLGRRALYVVNLLLLGLVMRGGHSALGAQRWISLGPLGTFQPSEPAKLVLAIVIAAMLARTPVGQPPATSS